MEDQGKKPEKRALMLGEQRMELAEYLRQDWVATAEAGTLIDDVIDPGYWSHMASKMKLYDRIEVRMDTGDWLLELLVLDVGRNWARVVILHQHDLQPADGESFVPDRFTPKFRGPVLKWSVIRAADSHVLIDKLETKQAAVEWIDRYEKNIGA